MSASWRAFGCNPGVTKLVSYSEQTNGSKKELKAAKWLPINLTFSFSLVLKKLTTSYEIFFHHITPLPTE